MLSSEVAPTSQLTNLQNCVINGNCASLGTYTQPTGTVTFADGSNTINTAVMNAEGDAEYNAPFAVGTHSVVATYNGDQSYNKVTSSPIAFTVVKDTPQLIYGVSNQNSNGAIISGQPTVFNAIVENNAQYTACSPSSTTGACQGALAPVPVAPPTGTVTLSSSPAGISGTITLSAGVDPSDSAQAGIGTVTLASTLAAGNYNVTFAYSGDGNYFGESEKGTIQVVAGAGLATTTTATASGSTVSPNAAITISGTVTGQSGHPAPTGGILVVSSGEYIGELTLTAGSSDVSTFSTVISSQVLFQGANFVTLQYTGDSTYANSEFTLNGGASIANPLADFTLVPNTTIVPISISGGANTGNDTINVASVNGFTGTVNLTCAATSPLTCSVTPNPSVAGGSPATSTLTINVPASTASENYSVVVTGTDAATGEFIHTAAVTADVTGTAAAETLTNSGNITVVQGASNSSLITVTPSGGFTGTVNLSCAVTSAPTGASTPITCAAANLSPSSVDITNTVPITSVLTINTSATTTNGSYQVTVTGTSGSLTSSTVVNVTVNLPQDYALSNSGAITLSANAQTGNTATITVTPSGGFALPVALSCTSVSAPSGASNPFTCSNVSLTPATVTLPGTTTSTLAVTTTTTTTTGSYVVTVTGLAGTLEHTTTVNVTVTAAVAATFSLSNSGGVSITPGATSGNTSTITVTPGSTGFTGTVALTCAISPTASSDPATCALSPASVTLSGTTKQTSTLTVTTTAATAELVVPSFGKGKGPLGTLFGAGSGAVLGLLIFFGIPARRRSWRSMLSILVAIVALGVLSSCGGGSSSSGIGGTTPSNPGTTAGTYTVTVTGNSGSIVQTTPVALSVQ